MQREELRKLRGNASLREVADKFGITRQMLGAIESGQRNPSLRLAKIIADYYGVLIEDIFFDHFCNGMLPKCQLNGEESTSL